MAISRPLGAGHPATHATDQPAGPGPAAVRPHHRAALGGPGLPWTSSDARRYRRHTTHLQVGLVIGLVLSLAVPVLSAA